MASGENGDHWHFTRRRFAEQTLTALADGPAKALTLFGPRRTGKTEFLLKDLAPAAEARGHRAIYVSFWQEPMAPLAALLHALEMALKRGSFADRLRHAGHALSPKLQLSVPGVARAEIDVSSLGRAPPSELLLHLDDLLGRVARRRKSTILMLDEVQELAQSDQNQPLVAALRTGLDKRPDELKAIFTGSSREGLRTMFSTRQAPFFHYAASIDLPPLGEPFVDHMLKAMARITDRRPERAEMVAAFDQLHRNPYYFRTLVETMLMNPQFDTAEAVAEVRDRVAAELGYGDIWLALMPLQRAVAYQLLNDTRPFSHASRTALGQRLDEETPSPSRVQAALRKLQRLGIADRQNGSWRLVDPGFADWVRAAGL